MEEEKLLLPVGYSRAGRQIEMLVEVSKEVGGTYTVALISASEDTRNLFDREVGSEEGSQSLRREITNVNKDDLLAAIPSLIELQTSPRCLSEEPTNEWQNIFFQTIKFEGSIVQPGDVKEPYRTSLTTGHLGEMLSYTKGEKAVGESRRFELAVRLRAFLDICNNNKKGFKDKAFWTLVRTTAHQLAHLIESEKELIGTSDAQGKELTRILWRAQSLPRCVGCHRTRTHRSRKEKTLAFFR